MNWQMREKVSGKFMIVFIVAAALIIIAAVAVSTAYKKNDRTGKMVDKSGYEQLGNMQDKTERELMGVFGSKEEAEAAAELYNIKLKDFGQRVAVFTADPGVDIQELIEKGKSNGWPELSINYKRDLY